ncbi:type II toxin-antitoxin system RelE family toxin [Subtercola vilae]|uniref:Type II toxin-antitoxin system RelE/ParE family toxin n=1 Tax=Subtercola vilae TaxID=2056433 RepID=A0A4T2BHG6_9MICO|nr:type II toxin-antitoxin system RelE/ParE family toxin [Subtercola vilae]TIH30795.1 type II toxin-antitoxin system RelE/ParE family toxin [Subtercola vilae]
MSSADDDGYEVEFAGTARRDLRAVPPRIVPAIIEFVYGDLARYPRRVGKPLQRELEGLWGARRGPYRIIYDIVEERLVIIVVHVDHRADVYRSR